MRVLFCGTGAGGDSFQLDRANASVVIEHGGSLTMLDCGPGSLRTLVADGRALTEIDAVLLSHIHQDHVLGLAELFGRLVALNAGTPPPIYGPRGTADFAARLRELVRPLARRDASVVDEIVGSELDPGGVLEIGGVQFTAFEVRHAPELQAFGWRAAAEGKVVVYSGDTAAAPDLLLPFAQDCDLLIHDAFSTTALAGLVESRREELRERVRTIIPTIHGVAADVGALATALRARQLAVTTINPYEDLDVLESEIRSGYSGPFAVAYDGLALTV